MAERRSKKDETDAAASAARRELTEEEAELVVRVLQRHRVTLPSYLLSMQKEISLIDSILAKLS